MDAVALGHNRLIQQLTRIVSTAIERLRRGEALRRSDALLARAQYLTSTLSAQLRLSQESLAQAKSDLARMARVTSLGGLTASIVHELTQPLSGIVTNVSTCLRMLAAEPPNLDGARETARRTIRDAERASELISRLRAFFAKESPTTESVDLNEAIKEVIALSSPGLRRGEVVLRAELADDLPPVKGDRVQLEQVILNLLLNAAEAMGGIDDRPRLLMVRTARDEGERVRLTIRDVGVGFESQDMERLFEAFYTTKRGGIGIGLSVSRSIIESHHGRLWAALNEDGPGASVSFCIPCEPEGHESEFVRKALMEGGQM
jgi:C4-dicarboxylate-specific signal transduction histidine kinase